MVRTGDTPSAVRRTMTRQPPHILVTTPESLHILLTSDSGRASLAGARTVIVDEIHALAASKRGSHLALTLERLEALCGGGGGEAGGGADAGAAARPLRRIGLSATQRPMELIASFLVGAHGTPPAPPPCAIVDEGFHRRRDLAIEVPPSPLEPVMSAEVWDEVYDRIAALAREHRTTLVFANTRRLAERAARALAERLGANEVASHHGSLSRERRFEAEQRLKGGTLTVLVATASLELGIDIGDVDLVCQLGSTRSIATFLQRVGRSGHGLEATPKGRLFPLSRDDLVECAALLDAACRGQLDAIAIPERPLDVLAQQLVAEVACREWRSAGLLALARRAWPYRDLDERTFEEVLEMLAAGFATRRGRRGAHLHRDRVNGLVRGRPGARLTALTNAGTIPENADYAVVLEPSGTVIGSLNEDFAIETLPGDVFQLGLDSWRILRVESGRVRVEDAHGQPPTIPFWIGEAPPRTEALSAAVSELRAAVGRLAAEAGPEDAEPDAAAEDADGGRAAGGLERAARRVARDVAGLPLPAARQLVEYLAAGQAALGVMPTAASPVLERFFDESGGMQLVIHAPFGGRINRALGLALRKRFCRRFNFELQAAATEDNVVLSLGETHSFALEEVPGYLASATARDVLVQALLDAPIFDVRWRWNANTSLAVPRRAGGRKVPAPIQRMQAEDLVAAVFPDQIACAENLAGGYREVPDHPLVRQTVHDGLHEAMDADGLVTLLARIERGEVVVHARDLTEPSPFAHEILNAKPYAFLDDAPLEERRTRAVSARRWLDPASAADVGRLDPEAIRRVREEAWPETGTADALHDALVVLGFLTAREMREALGMEGAGEREPLATLVRERRAGWAADPGGGAGGLWVAAERVLDVAAVRPDAAPALEPAPGVAAPASPEDALADLLRGRLGGLGPVTAAALAADLGIERARVRAALAALEGEGFVLRGRFTGAPEASGAHGREAAPEPEWCERRLLARIHRYTLARLRREIEPVEPADYMRFLFGWHGLDDRREGAGGLLAVLEQLEGFEAPAAAWEESILPARLRGYDPGWLDTLCLTGRVVWLRRTAPGAAAPAASGGARAGATAATRIAFLDRRRLGAWRPAGVEPGPDADPALSSRARRVREVLLTAGAQFFDDLREHSGLLAVQVEDGLAELVAAGLVTADGFSGLRALLRRHRRRGAGRARRPGGAPGAFAEAGRWCLVASRLPPPDPADTAADPLERIADVLLRRYAVVFRKVLEREAGLPPWRDLLRVLRRREDRGELRGGRFVAGFSGEQFALPEAIEGLRRTRRAPRTGRVVVLSAADPLNLTGVVTPGERVSAHGGREVAYLDGAPSADALPERRLGAGRGARAPRFRPWSSRR